MKETLTRAPGVGDYIRIFNGLICRIIKVRPLGTVDVETLDKSRHYRVSGLRMAAGY